MIKLMLGDCLERMQEIESGSVDMILTDPPYGTTQNKWDSVIPMESMWKQLKRIIKANGAILLFGQNMFLFKLAISNEKMYRYKIVWWKTKAVGFLNANRMPLRAHEDILVFYDGLPTYNPQFAKGIPYTMKYRSKEKTTTNYGQFDRVGRVVINEGKRYPQDVIIFESEKNPIHPTQKPLDLMAYLIATYTNEGETVLDFAMGGGTSMLASKNMNRRGMGIELDPEYFKIAQQRLENATRLWDLPDLQNTTSNS